LNSLGMYHKKNVDFSYLLWEDFVYQVEHEDAKKSNEMYYRRFTKVIVNFFMTKDPSIPRRNKFGAILPVELTNEAIRNSTAYKEYYTIASGAEPPKTKASVMKTQSSSNTTMPPLVAKDIRLQTSAKVDKPAKGKQPAKSSITKDEETDLIPRVPDVPTYESDEEISCNVDASHGMNVGGDEGPDAEDDDNELYGD
nr:hypothetical protein [Tanacetum cinerariifolium]